MFKNQFICITPVSGKNIALGLQKLATPRYDSEIKKTA
jgi:hypothetical protein